MFNAYQYTNNYVPLLKDDNTFYVSMIKSFRGKNDIKIG